VTRIAATWLCALRYRKCAGHSSGCCRDTCRFDNLMSLSHSCIGVSGKGPSLLLQTAHHIVISVRDVRHVDQWNIPSTYSDPREAPLVVCGFRSRQAASFRRRQAQNSGTICPRL
jgi:hypothetical protein